MTFSIAARCASTGMFGMAVSSSSPAVAARCAHARAKVGAVAAQNVTDPALGPAVLDRLAAGLSAQKAVAEVMAGHSEREFRQVTAVDGEGRTAIFTGSRGLGTIGEAHGTDCVAAGNLLAHDGVPKAMTDAFAAASGHLAERLMEAMAAAVAAGGEKGPVRSAGLVVVDRQTWPIVDLRVDWDEDADPVGRLAALWRIYGPQVDDYVLRAERPSAAPGYGVPGDE
jgi:uncharacterized Ntn-hydrolase superfamily protein